MISAIALLEFSNGEWNEIKQVISQVFVIVIILF